MRGWTIQVGRFFGVDVSIHLFFVVLFGLSISIANFAGVSVWCGFALIAFLLGAVCLREIARAVVGAWFGLTPRSLVLLPTGAIAYYGAPDEDNPYPVLGGAHEIEESKEAKPDAKSRREERGHIAIAIAGPLTNFAFGLVVAAIVLTFSPEVNLIQMPWVTPRRLLRALVWINLLLGAVNLIPAWPLDGGRLFRGKAGKTRRTSTAMGIGPILAVALIVAGMLVPSMWLLLIGVFVLVASQFQESTGSVVDAGGVETVTMRDVMMEDYTVLSASATLEDAMRHATHTLQDVFPVVRGGNLVGAVSRQNIAEALEAGGNSYVQGIMTRSFQTAKPGDALMKTLRRIMSAPVSGQTGQAAQLVPIVDATNEERIVGIITPQNLQRSMRLLDQTRRIRRASDFQKEQDKL